MELLIDADILIYESACRNQLNIDWGDDVLTQHTELEAAKETIDNQIGILLRDTKCKHFQMCLSSETPNFRYDVLPSYKHNRRDKPRPLLRSKLIDYVKETYPFKQKPGLEGDDVLGILATRDPGRYLIATLDKDIDQIPGDHYNWRKGVRYKITEAEGDYFFFYQVLVGDPTDGYSGCPGIGKVKAEKLLDSVTEYYTAWDVIIDAYGAKGLTEEDALQQARVARILRATDYNFRKKVPILWSPT